MQEAGVWVLLDQITYPPGYCTGACHQHKWIWDPTAPSGKGGLGLVHTEMGKSESLGNPFHLNLTLYTGGISADNLRVLRPFCSTSTIQKRMGQLLAFLESVGISVCPSSFWEMCPSLSLAG